MSEQNLCTRPPLPWLGVKGSLSEGLIRPEWMIPLLLILALLPLATLPRRWRRIGMGLASLPLAIYLFLLTPWGTLGLETGLTAGVPPDLGERAEAIVVLGRGAIVGRWQVETAAELWQQGRAPVIWGSGAIDGPWMEEQLQEQGIPEHAVSSEGCSQTTYENARCAAMRLQPQGIDRIILVTDGPHMLRSWLTFRSFGFTVIPHIVPVADRPQLSRFPLELVREYGGLASYGILGRFAPQSEPDPSLCHVGDPDPI